MLDAVEIAENVRTAGPQWTYAQTIVFKFTMSGFVFTLILIP